MRGPGRRLGVVMRRKTRYSMWITFNIYLRALSVPILRIKTHKEGMLGMEKAVAARHPVAWCEQSYFFFLFEWGYANYVIRKTDRR